MIPSGPMQPPLLPSSQSPERLRFMEKVNTPEDLWKSRPAERNQAVWFFVILAAFGLMIAGALLVFWLLHL